MRILGATFLLALILCAPFTSGYSQRPKRPGLVEAAKAQQKLQVDPPRPAVRPGVDPLKLKQEAVDLSKLVATVQQQLDDVAKGLLHKDLDKNLKQVEKLAKHLRSEITPP